jgi:glycine oxidase
MDDVLIIGGGVIGLTSALELAQAGLRVGVVDHQAFGREASWAGAGMIPPGEVQLTDPAYRQLAQLSAALWPDFSQQLREQTGLDNEYQSCGAVLFAESAEAEDDLLLQMRQWTAQSIPALWLDRQELQQQLPGVSAELPAFLLPTQAQVRNPRHVQAMLEACRLLGVRLLPDVEVREVLSQGERIQAVRTDAGDFSAGQFLWATGAWSGLWESQLEWTIPVCPIRGHILLLQSRGEFSRILEQGKRYLVPRRDGRVLVGSNEERVDFHRQPDAAVLEELLAFACRMVPGLSTAERERGWCGFRPGSPDQLPIIGAIPGWENVFVATGHHRAGLSLSAATGRVVRELLLEQELSVDLTAFSPARFAPPIVVSP